MICGLDKLWKNINIVYKFTCNHNYKYKFKTSCTMNQLWNNQRKLKEKDLSGRTDGEIKAQNNAEKTKSKTEMVTLIHPSLPSNLNPYVEQVLP